MMNLKVLFLLIIIIIQLLDANFVSPILEIEDEAKGYFGTIDEHSLFVTLEPQLKVKNKVEISKPFLKKL